MNKFVGLKKNIRIILLLLTALTISVGISEVVLRLALPAANQYYVWQPGLHATLHPDSTVFCGVKGEKHFDINEKGFRGNIFKENFRDRKPRSNYCKQINKNNNRKIESICNK